MNHTGPREIVKKSGLDDILKDREKEKRLLTFNLG
jgi:hypothetical protein